MFTSVLMSLNMARQDRPNTNMCSQYCLVSTSHVDRTLTNPFTRLPFVHKMAVISRRPLIEPFESSARRQRGDDPRAKYHEKFAAWTHYLHRNFNN